MPTSPRRFTTALLATVRRGGRLCPPKHRVAGSFRASDRRHWRGNPSPLSRQPAALAATYLCRFAAKARFDNRQPPKGVSKEGGPQPSLFGRSRMEDFQGGRKIETSFPLEWRSLVTFFRQGKKVTRRRQKGKGQKERKILHGRTAPSAPTTAYRAYALPQNIPIILPHLPPPRNLPSRASFM